jgi:stage II sporulation protein AA (anti-sigma F factor antagonist)
MPDLNQSRDSATPELDMSHEKLRESPRVVKVRIGCDVEAGNGQEVEKYFNYVLQAEQPRHVLLDLGGVTFGDTAFFSLLLFMKEEVQKGGGQLVLFGVRPELHSTLRLLSFDKFLTIRADKAAALAALPSQ